MRVKLIFLYALINLSNISAQPYLSSLKAGTDSPVFTTYASSLETTNYSTDEGYQLIWSDPEQGISLKSEQSGIIGLGFAKTKSKFTLKEFYQKPVITTTYSNYFSLYYYPFPNIRVEYIGLVKDSETLILDVTIENQNNTFPVDITLYPYLMNNKEPFREILKEKRGIYFKHNRKADSWMKEHKIPYQEALGNYFLIDKAFSDYNVYSTLSGLNSITVDILTDKPASPQTEGNLVIFELRHSFKPGEKYSFRLVRTLFEPSKKPESIERLFIYNSRENLLLNEKLYRNVPKIKFNNKDSEALYWNAFNLMRQCFMGPEGKSSYNYYVFSREPKWGWGYGGQVFHESLTMLAYAYLDPLSAMNSQRVYFERQFTNGYINYRTGPYLDEQIPVDGQLTSSAPWFNWQNYEIYKISRDKVFLREAYLSGKKFYEYYISNRDTDNDGLCEWGADAVLESVRDARVAVWDEVGDPRNFESLDCNLMLIKEAKSLAEMAAELGFLDEVIKFRKDALQRTYLVNKFMWDDDSGFYYNVNKKDHTFTLNNKNDLKRREIIAFLALWAGAADKDKAEKLMIYFKDPNEFYRNYGVPTLSANDTYYNPIGYWNGPIWIPWQYLVFRGLIDYGYSNEAEDLLNRISQNMIYQLKKNNYFWEFYSADDLQAGWNKAYIWSGLIARFFIDLNNLKN